MNKIEARLERLSSFIGNTPTLELFYSLDGEERSIFAKYEAWNFTGSVKDRMAFQIIKSAYHIGNLKPGDTIVEATSGNTGIAFAAMGAFLGHPVHIYMPNWLSEERKQLLKFYGAKLFEISVKDGGFLACISKAEEKSQKNGYFGPKQFANSWNVFAHQSTTAPELERSLNSSNIPKLDAFVAGAGTGGTIMGFYHYFSSKNDHFKAYPVFPSQNEDGGHRIEGIGDSFIPKILDLESLSRITRVNDSDAINIARQINKMGLSTGISSGANVFASILKSEELEDGSTIATILCDGNKKYLSTDLCSDSIENLTREIKILDYRILT
tara:strand:+ start:7375 stop:8352 length:978 start_codon:yes stop_codon:yes gene_type:complete